jgi:hypothetical protein
MHVKNGVVTIVRLIKELVENWWDEDEYDRKYYLLMILW